MPTKFSQGYLCHDNCQSKENLIRIQPSPKYSSSIILNDVKFFFRAILFQEYNRKSIELSKAKGVPTFSNNRKLHNTRDVHIK